MGPDSWTRTDGPHVNAYAKSKTLAEAEAWQQVSETGARQRLAVINPGTMVGPLLDDDPGTSVAIIQRMLRGDMPMLPNMMLPFVDVADVVDAHVEAMLSPIAGGRRHVVALDAQPLGAIAEILRSRVPELAGKLPLRTMPGWLAALVSLFDRSLRDSRAYLAVPRRYDAASGAALLGRPLRPIEPAIENAARSLFAHGLL